MAKDESKINEDAPANAVGGGAIAGVGIGAAGEPGVTRNKAQIIGTLLKRKRAERVK